MRRILGLLAVLVLALGILAPGATADEYVRGHYRNGKWVRGYYRSDRNGTVRDNWSYRGNVNPHTGRVGTNRYYGSPSSAYYDPNRSYGRGGGLGNIGQPSGGGYGPGYGNGYGPGYAQVGYGWIQPPAATRAPRARSRR